MKPEVMVANSAVALLLGGIAWCVNTRGRHPGLAHALYLLALRHPVPVAREIATLCESAPGRLVLGVGVGGEDRHEIEICGVDPRTRGRRTSESLETLRGLLSGEPVTHRGEFFAFDVANRQRHVKG